MMIVRVELMSGDVFYMNELDYIHLSDDVVCKVQETKYVRLLDRSEAEELATGVVNWYDDDPLGEVVSVPSFLRRQAGL